MFGLPDEPLAPNSQSFPFVLNLIVDLLAAVVDVTFIKSPPVDWTFRPPLVLLKVVPS